MTKEEAKKILTEYVKACREDDMLTLEQFTYEEVIEAMDIGAEAISVLPVSSDLKEAAENIARDVCKQLPNGEEKDGIVYYAILAAIAGAKWQADHTPLPEDTVLFNKGVAEGRRLAEEEQADMFTIVALDAAQRAKEQMMKEAVEAEISAKFPIVERSLISVIGMLEGFKYGDKVRIIIIKGNEK